MARLARVVAPGLPRHVTQRGNRRQQTFFSDDDYQSYLAFMAKWCSAHDFEIWTYCLMPNHVQLIAVPQSADGLKRAISEAHRLRAHQRTGRPLGEEAFLASLEQDLGRILRRQEIGPEGRPQS